MSKLDHTFEPKAPLRRVEVITGTGRRRQFSADDKARMVAQTLAPGRRVGGRVPAGRLLRQEPDPDLVTAADEVMGK